MRRIKELLRLSAAGRSQREIARALGLAKRDGLGLSEPCPTSGCGVA